MNKELNIKRKRLQTKKKRRKVVAAVIRIIFWVVVAILLLKGVEAGNKYAIEESKNLKEFNQQLERNMREREFKKEHGLNY